MANFTWSSNASGDWNTLQDWGANVSALPGVTDNVSIDVPGVTVTIASADMADALTLSTQYATLNLDGSLFTVQQATFGGVFNANSGAKFTLSGYGATFNNTVNIGAGATVDVVDNTLNVNDGGTLAGKFTGAGTLSINGGQTYLSNGFSSSLAAITVTQNGRLGLYTQGSKTTLTLSRNISVLGGSLDLFGNLLTLSGNDVFEGVVGSGTIIDKGGITLGGTFGTNTLNNGTVLEVYGTVRQANLLYLGSSDAGAKVIVEAGGQYDINGNWNIADPSTIGWFTNDGLLAKTGGGKASTISTSFTNAATASVRIDIGSLFLAGAVNALGGSISGAGTFGVASGQTTLASSLILSTNAFDQTGGQLILNHSLTYANEWDISGGALDLNTAATVLTLNGAANFEGGLVSGYGGTLVLNGAAAADNGVTFGGPDLIDINKSFDQTGNINFGLYSNPVGRIAADASWIVENNGQILGYYGQIENAGQFDVAGGNGYVQPEMLSSGTLTVQTGELTLAGLSNQLSGTVDGGGTLNLLGSTDLAGGLSIGCEIDVSGALTLDRSITDAEAFTQLNTNSAIDLNSYQLSLSGVASLDAGMIYGGGTLSAAGATTLGLTDLEAGATLLITGTADQAGTVTDNALLDIGKGATYSVQDDFSIVGGGRITLDGALVEGGAASAAIFPFITLESGGSLIGNDAGLYLGGGASLSGTLGGTGIVTLGAGTFTIGSGFDMTAAQLALSSGVTLALASNGTIGNGFSTSAAPTLVLNNHTLTLGGGASLGGVILGAGGISMTGAGTLTNSNISGGVTLAVSGGTKQLGGIELGSAGGTATADTLLVAKGGTYGLGENVTLAGSGTLSVQSGGTVLDGAHGTAALDTGAIVDAGTIAENLGVLQIGGAVSGAGSFSIGGTGLLEFLNSATIGTATMINFAGSGAYLQIDNYLDFDATLENFAKGDTIQLNGMDGTTLTGTYGASTSQILVQDARGDNTVLNFSSPQTLSSLSFTHGANGVALVLHT